MGKYQPIEEPSDDVLTKSGSAEKPSRAAASICSGTPSTLPPCDHSPESVTSTFSLTVALWTVEAVVASGLTS